MRRRWPIIPLMVALGTVFSATAYAGPPFLTDDPEPVEYQHSEFYVFSLLDATKGSSTVLAPACEYNYGIAPETQFHVWGQFACVASSGNPTEYGLGDMQIGVKYRFLKETDDWPQLAVYPLLMVPTGNAGRGLGNGSVWTQLPLWAQKSFGKWTTYGGIGLSINPGAGHNNSLFGGWLLERKLTEKLTLGGEIYCQGADRADSQSSALFNLGGFYDFSEQVHFLFSGGYTLAGERHTPGYLGLQYTW